MEQYKDEIWKDVEGFEGYYKLSNFGRIYSYPRLHSKGGYSYGSKNGRYLKFALSKNGKITAISAHILVYKTFIGDVPKGYDVHHINHNPKDNRIENLELIDEHTHSKMHYEENKIELIKNRIDKLSKPIIQYTKNMEFVAEYKSAQEAEKITGINQGNISMCCLKKKYKTVGGYVWRFKE